MTVFEQIVKLLDEPAPSAAQRVRNCLDSIYASGADVILYGAGNVGRQAARILQGDNRELACFADNNESLWGTVVEGVEVMPLERAVKQYADKGVFIVTAFNREFSADYRGIRSRLKSYGAKQVYPFPILAWRYPDQLLPHFAQGVPADILPHREQILKVYKRFDDDRSKEIFLEFVRVSTLADYDAFSDPDPAPTYFPAEVLAALPGQVTVADCGAYDGDTLRSFFKSLGPDRLSQWHAFEPDRENFKALTAFVSTLSSDLQRRITCHPTAVGDENNFLKFDSTGTESSRVSAGGNGISVESVTLDAIFKSHKCDLIKMDIEGFERNALVGARNCLERDQPVLAISAYHRADDFFHLPSLVNFKNRKYMLRRYMSYFYETVYYDIPLAGGA